MNYSDLQITFLGEWIVLKSFKVFLNRGLSFTFAGVLSFGLGLVSMTYTPQAQAWGQNGHRIIGQIAFNHLTPIAREKVLALLSGDLLPEVTTWADEMRSNPDTFWRKDSPKWHYMSIDKWSDFKPNEYAFPHNDDPKDIFSAILKSITQLQNANTSRQDKEFYLRFLTHLIGDLHMPLHVGRAEDHGGNKVDVKFFRKEMNLHTLWDTELIESQNLSYKDFAEFIDTKDPKQLSTILNSGITDWIKESYDLRDGIYPKTDESLRWDYQYQYMFIVKMRLLQGGIRLAGVLNRIFDPEAKIGVSAIKYFHKPQH
jgi:hypothetical protein